MNSDDLKNIGECFQTTHDLTTTIVSSQSLVDHTGHKGSINDAISAVEGVVVHYDGIVKTAQNQRDNWRLKKKILERDYEKVKDSYWNLKREEDRTYLPA